MKKTLQECKEIVSNNGGFIYEDIQSASLKEQLTDLANKMYYEQSEWISVEDALPDEYGLYLTIRESSLSFTRWFGLGGFSDDFVTHWQSLPNPPQK